MRIALLSEKFPPDSGGLAVSAGRLAQGLLSRGNQVHVFALTGGQPGQVTCQVKGGLTIRRLGAFRRTDDTLSAWYDDLVQQHRQHAFDLLHGYFITQAGFVAAYAGRALGLPGVVSARGNDLDRAVFDPGKAAHVLYALQSAAAITANTNELARKAGALSSGRVVTLVPNGVDASRFCRLPRDERLANELGLEDDRLVVGFSGEVRQKKGLPLLLAALSRLGHRHPLALLVVGGTREAEDTELLEVFRRQNTHTPLHITGFIDHAAMPACYNLMDVLALPSLRDGLPNALLEGMACERAVLAAAVGGIPDAVRDGEEGALFPPNDPGELERALEGLLQNPERRQALGATARQRVLQDFTLEAELAANLAVYRQLGVMG